MIRGSSHGSTLSIAAGHPRALAGAMLGIWLFISIFLWPHTQDQMMVAWTLGLLLAVVGAAAAVAPDLRFVAGLLAILLFLSAIILPSVSPATGWNSVLVALALLLVSFGPRVEMQRVSGGRGSRMRPHVHAFHT
jgi:hypothetical protein